MKYSSLSAAAAICLAAFALPAHAQEARVGFVDQDRVMREATLVKAAEAKLNAEFSKRQTDLAAMDKALQAASERFEREAPTLSESQRGARQKQLIDQDREFQRKRRELQEDATTRRNEELQQFFDRATRAVKQVAEAEKYDVILREAAYVSPKHDITDKVIRALNAPAR